jgi:hypothetical protein
MIMPYVPTRSRGLTAVMPQVKGKPAMSFVRILGIWRTGINVAKVYGETTRNQSRITCFMRSCSSLVTVFMWEIVLRV